MNSSHSSNGGSALGTLPQPQTPAQEPALVGLKSASPSTEPPAGLTKFITNRISTNFSTSGRDRLAAENFAVSFAQLQFDTRENADHDAALRELTSRAMPPEVQRYLHEDYAEQLRVHTERYFDPDDDAWMRSGFVGREDSPSRVNVQLGGVLRAAVVDFGSFYIARVDVVWEDGQWKVADFSSGFVGPTVPSPRDELRAALPGRYWREL